MSDTRAPAPATVASISPSSIRRPGQGFGQSVSRRPIAAGSGFGTPVSSSSAALGFIAFSFTASILRGSPSARTSEMRAPGGWPRSASPLASRLTPARPPEPCCRAPRPARGCSRNSRSGRRRDARRPAVKAASSVGTRSSIAVDATSPWRRRLSAYVTKSGIAEGHAEIGEAVDRLLPADHAVGAVLEDQHDEIELEADRRLQLLAVHHEAAVAADRHARGASG